MRLIDADALREVMYHEAFEKDTDMQKWDGGCWIRYKMFENAIESAPTIEAEPVRRGKWVVAGNTTHYYICSVCGKPGDGFDIYCRSCGAKMERPCDKCQEWDCYGCDYKQTEGEEHETD